MAIRKQGKFWYSDTAADIREVLAVHPSHDAHPCTHFADVVCECGGMLFDLLVDDDLREAEFPCLSCKRNYLFHLADEDGRYEGDPKSDTWFRTCPCDESSRCSLEVVVGVRLVLGSDIPSQVSIGCRCTKCGLTASYADWDRVALPYQRVFAHTRNEVLPE